MIMHQFGTLFLGFLLIVDVSLGRRLPLRSGNRPPRPIRRPISSPFRSGGGGSKPVQAERFPGRLGSLSRKYESGSRGPGTINPFKSGANGDSGGASYGTYQISTKKGTMKTFLEWTNKRDPTMTTGLAKLTPGTSAFDTEWKNLAKTKPKEFESIQHDFIKSTHYDPTLSRLSSKYKLDLNLNARSPVIQDVIWSTSVQHGAKGGAAVIQRALANQDLTKMTDKEIISRIYSERGADNGKKYFGKNSDKIRESVVERFNKEQKDALEQLN